MRYYFYEIKDFVPCQTASALAALLKSRFRPYTHAYHVQQQLTNLRMSAGGYLTYAERFIEMAAQQRHLHSEVLLNNFLAGLTQEFCQECMVRKVTSRQRSKLAVQCTLLSTQLLQMVSKAQDAHSAGNPRKPSA